MKRSSTIFIVLFCLWCVSFAHLQAQTLQVSLSPVPKVNRATTGGTATIFFDSDIEDLSIVCTEENPNEQITKINDHQWFVNIDVNKDIEADGICYRNYILKCTASAEYYLTTDEIAPNQVLYYTVTLPNELEPELQEEKSKYLAAKSVEVAIKGNSLLARKIALEALDNRYTVEAEAALRQANLNDNAVLKGHTSSVNHIALSPDCKLIASASTDGSVRLWDVHTGKCVFVLKDHTSVVSCVSYTPDGKSIATSSWDDTIRIWDVKKGICTKKMECDGFSNTISFNQDGSLLASGSNLHTIQIWDIKTGKCIKKMEEHTGWVNSIVFSSDGENLISVSNDSTIRIWDTKSWKCKRILKGHSDIVASVSISPNGKFIASASYDKSVIIWDANTGKPLKTLLGHSNYIESVSFCHNNTYVITSSLDGTIRLWNTQTGDSEWMSKKHDNIVRFAIYDHINDHIIVASGNDVFIEDYIHMDFNGQVELFGHDNIVYYAEFSKDGKQLLTSSADNTIKMWDVTGLLKKTFTGHENTVENAFFSSDGQSIMSFSSDYSFRVWDDKTGDCLQTITNFGQFLTYSPKKSQVAFVPMANRYSIHLWNVNENRTINYLNRAFPEEVHSAKYSPDSRKIATTTLDGLIQVWNIDNAYCETTFKNPSGLVYSIDYSPDGREIITAASDNSIRIWNLNSHENRKVLIGHQNEVTCAKYFSSGKYIVSGSEDNTVRVWDAETGCCVVTYLGHTAPITHVSISPDDKYIVSSSKDRTAIIWEFPSLETLVIKTQEQFKNFPLSQEEMRAYDIQ